MSQPEISPGRVEHSGSSYWIDSRNALVPAELVKPADQLRDELVREIVAASLFMQAQIAGFRDRTFKRVDDFVELLAQQYQAKAGGEKGNVTLTSFDNRLKVEVKVAERIAFGPELKIAKDLADECVLEWSAGSNAHVRALVMKAFDVDKDGEVKTHSLLSLLSLAIDDERWKRAMDAVTASMMSAGSKRYVRIYFRASAKDKWSPIPLSMANA